MKNQINVAENLKRENNWVQRHPSALVLDVVDLNSPSSGLYPVLYQTVFSSLAELPKRADWGGVARVRICQEPSC